MIFKRVPIQLLALPVFLLFALSSYAAEIPRPEHPRPDFRRDAWLNLNGAWNFAFDPENAGETNGWFQPDYADWPKTITVPYPWESRLSGIADTNYKGTAWYQRRFTLPAEWNGKQILLHFGAVDWYAKVWVDGTLVGEHDGGYTPFSFVINPALQGEGEHVLTVKVIDTTNPEHPVGKQVNWYTTTSGIWQTVYLEAAGPADRATIQDVRFTTTVDGRVSVEVTPSRPTQNAMQVVLLPDVPPDDAGSSASIHSSDAIEGGKGEITVENPQLWSPESPTLYFVQLNLFDGSEMVDSIHTYFAFREVGRGKYGGMPDECILLNGKPFYILSALNQAFHPDGIYTYPTDQAIRKDVEDTLEFGFNNLRIHIKVDEPRLYYWADRLGLTLLYDMPCFIKFTEEAKRTFEYTMRQAIARDKNHPSILAWVIFNETWGLNFKYPEQVEFVKDMYAKAKALDPTRLVEDNSACNYDHIVTDINSWHFYIYDHAKAREHIEHVVKETFPGSPFNFQKGYFQETQPLINSEYGGVSAGMGDRDISWCFHYLTQELRRHPKIMGYVYTELQDIEWEHNGFMNYDRSRKVFGYEEFVPVPEGHKPFTCRDLNAADFLILGATPGERLPTPRDTDNFMGFFFGAVRHQVPVALSLFSGREGGDFQLKWQLYGMGSYDAEWIKYREGHAPISGKPYTVTEGKPIRLKFWDDPGRLYVLYAWVEDSKGNLVARNFWTCVNFGSGVSREYALRMWSRTEYYYCWEPVEYESITGMLDEFPKGGRDVVSIPGEASVTYLVKNHQGTVLTKKSADEAYLMFELAACAGNERVDWKERIRAKSTPQTDVENQYPSKVEVWVKDELLATLDLPDDPADYRGILSNIFRLAPPSSYGYFQRLSIPKEILEKDAPFKVEIKTAPGTQGGLRVFGRASGRYPTPPTLMLVEK